MKFSQEEADNQLMRFLRYLFALWVAVATYSILAFVFGPTGLYARNHLQAEKQRLEENLETLEITNSGFLNTARSLQADEDALSVYMRQLGYSRDGETFVRIMGLGNPRNAEMPSGQVLYAVDPDYVSDRTIKIVAAVLGLAVFVFFLASDFLSGRIGPNR